MKSVSNEDQVGFDNFVKLMETRVSLVAIYKVQMKVNLP